jgi:hypothetical protein
MLDLSEFASLDDAISLASASDVYFTTLLSILNLEVGARMGMNLMFAQSMVSRCQGMHKAIIREIQRENPHAVFPLLRSLVEAFALLNYVADHPGYIDVLTVRAKDIPKGKKQRLSIQKLVAHAFKRAPGLKHVYAELSEITHFGSVAMWTPHRVTNAETHEIAWSNHPCWRDEEQALIACAQTIEISEAINFRLSEFLDEHCREGGSPTIAVVTHSRPQVEETM